MIFQFEDNKFITKNKKKDKEKPRNWKKDTSYEN